MRTNEYDLNNKSNSSAGIERFNETAVYDELSSILRSKGETFSDYLFRLIDERQMKDSSVYRAVGIERNTFAKLRRPDYHPGKRLVLSLIIGTQLSVDEADTLLKKAGYSFCNDDETDLIVKYFLENRLYELSKINEALDHFGLEPLLPRERPGRSK